MTYHFIHKRYLIFTINIKEQMHTILQIFIKYCNQTMLKMKMTAKQLSQRGGSLVCELKGDRVIMGGKCIFYMKGEIALS